jgi:hypothetical protein
MIIYETLLESFFFNREFKFFVNRQRDKKFSFEIDFMNMILKILTIAFWLAYQNIYMCACDFHIIT